MYKIGYVYNVFISIDIIDYYIGIRYTYKIITHIFKFILRIVPTYYYTPSMYYVYRLYIGIIYM